MQSGKDDPIRFKEEKPQVTISPRAAVIVGSLHYDIMVEASHRPVAGETVSGDLWYPKFGGKGGNQAAAIARSGGTARMVSAVGDDSFGPYLREHLTKGGVCDRFVTTLEGRASGMSVALMDASRDYGAVIVSGANLAIPPSSLAEDALWINADWLVLQNEAPEATNLAAATAARSRNVRVCLNAAPVRRLSTEFASLIDMLVVNAVEAEALCRFPVTNLADAERAANTLSCSFPIVIVTAGGDGVAFAKGDDRGSVPAVPVVVVSTHGAGDMFIGSLIGALLKDCSLSDAVMNANKAAAQHVSQPKLSTAEQKPATGRRKSLPSEKVQD